MPIDDNEIDEQIQKLDKLRLGYRQKETDIMRIINNLVSVKMVEYTDPDEPDPEKSTKRRDPIDNRTGLTFVSQIRQKIYDDNILQAKKLTV